MRKSLCNAEIDRFHRRKAFTLVELLLVVVVIGVLFVSTAQRIDNVTDKSKVAGVQTDFREFYKATKAVGLEKQLYLLTSSEFEEKLNDKLDPSLKFINGICEGKDPWKTAYRYTTKVEGKTFYILFTSNGGRNYQEFVLDSVEALGGTEEGTDIIEKEEFKAKLNLYMKQENTTFYALSEEDNGVRAELAEEAENLIRHPSFANVKIYNGGASPTGSVSALRNDDTIKFSAGSGITLSVGADKTITIASTEGAGLRSEMETINNYINSHKSDGIVHITASERTKWNGAVDHSESAHAPANAERNIIVGIKVNGAAINPDSSRKVNITVPTKLSQFVNDADYTTNAILNQAVQNINQNITMNDDDANARMDDLQTQIDNIASVRKLNNYVMNSLTYSIEHEYFKGCTSVKVNFAEQYNLAPTYTINTTTGELTISCTGTLPASGAVIETIEIYYK